MQEYNTDVINRMTRLQRMSHDSRFTGPIFNIGGDMLIESNLQLSTRFTYINCATITTRDSINTTFFIFWNPIFESTEDFL